MKKLYLFAAFLLCGFSNHLLAQSPWVEQNVGYIVPSAYPTDIDAVDSSVVWTVAASGDGSGTALQLFSRTTDGGATWNSLSWSASPDFSPSGISAVDSMTAYVLAYNATVGSGGGLFKTTDGGVTWDTVAPSVIYPTVNSFPDLVYFWDAGTGVLMGDPESGYFEIYRTNDSGQTWNRVPSSNIAAPVSGEYGLVNSYCVVGSHIWFGTNMGRVYMSPDSGNTWTASSVVNNLNSVSSITFRDSLNGLAIKSPSTGASTLYRTLDGGMTWAQTLFTGPFFSSDIKYIPGTTKVVSAAASSTGRGSSISMDEGATWLLLDTAGAGTVDGYTTLEFIDSTYGWAGGFAVDQTTGGIFKWAGTSVGITTVSNSDHNITVYPNPANDVVYISAEKAFTDNVNVTVMDILGNTVRSEGYAQSRNPLQVNMQNLPSGVYFIRVESGSSFSVSRIVKD